MKSDKELNALFEEHVTKWRQPGIGMCFDRPYWTEDANAVLPWLEKAGYWKCERHHDGVYVASQAEGFLSCAKADTFPRAAVIALLRAKGVEV